tara:strand:- start:1967 stop:2227 length:261 start_codon:yes stop_codon:yes gene_type:complete
LRNKQNNQYHKKGAGNILSNKEVDFEDAMSDDDYGIIISRTGELKGLFVPKIINNNENVPDSIVAIITDIFGLELDGNEENNITIH